MRPNASHRVRSRGRRPTSHARCTLALIALVLAAAGCVQPINVVHIAPGATADSLTFVLSGIHGGSPVTDLSYGLSVVTCNGKDVLWTITSNGKHPMPARIVYGDTIPGYPATTGPRHLTPGCYHVYVSETRPLRFEVHQGGAIQPSGPTAGGGNSGAPPSQSSSAPAPASRPTPNAH